MNYQDSHFSKGFLSALLLLPIFITFPISIFGESAPTAYLSKANLAIDLRKSGQYQQAIEQNLALLSQKQNVRNQLLIENCHKELGILYWNIGELSTSKANFLEALRIALQLGDKSVERFASQSIAIYDSYLEGKNYRAKGSTADAIASFSKAIEVSKSIGSLDHQIKCERQLSLVYYELGDYANYSQFNKSALGLARQTKNTREVSYCLNNIGIYYLKLEDYINALAACEEALRASRSIFDIRGETDVVNNMCIIYQELGDFERALNCISRSLEIDEKLGDSVQLSIDYINRGTIYRKRGLLFGNNEDYRSAILDFDSAFKLAEKNSDIEIEIAALNNLGSLFTDLEQYDEALKRFRSAYRLSEKSLDNEKKSRILNNLGVVSYKLGQLDKSNVYFSQALTIAAENQDMQLLWESFLESANSYAKQRKYKEALANYEKSIVLIEGIRSAISAEEFKASYLGTDKRLEAYQNLIDLLVTLHRSAPDKGYDKEAFNYLERAKARAFLDSLEVARIDISQGINPVMASREKGLMRDIARSYSRLLTPNLSSKDKDDIASKLKASEDQLETLKREIRASSPAYADLKYPTVIRYGEVKELLPTSDIAYIAYSVGKDSSFGFAITSRGLRVFNIPARKVIQQQVTAYRKAISNLQNRDFQLGRDLFQELVRPGLVPGLKKIMIIPDDVLNLLPFETLLTNKAPDSWLVRDYMIGYVPSLSSLRVLQMRHRNGSRPDRDLLAIGNPSYGSSGQGDGKLTNAAILYDLNSASGFNLPPLKYSELEIRNISNLFRAKKVTVLQKENASGRWLKSNPLTNYKIIHFAAHSIIDDKRPARSAIVLSYPQNQAGSGLLQTRDIYNLKLNADLVTLSSCQTGLGQFIRGEGIEGLSRAFFYAGSSSVLMSLWAVNDQATYLLMERFYRHLKGAESLMGALRNAKLEMIESRALSHPYYWAGFVINGRADVRIFSRKPHFVVLLIPLVAACFIVMIGISARRRQKPISQPIR